MAFDAVLTDIVMAGGEGIELIRNLRAINPPLAITAMSAVQSYLTAPASLAPTGSC
ncbi:MAG: hypothetical protein VW268_04800 [Rhodospirillaceae bacterium]